MTKQMVRDLGEAVEDLKLVLLGDELSRVFTASERAALVDAKTILQARILRELGTEARTT